MKSIKHAFYTSREWVLCREAYITSHSLCERCLSKGLVVPAEIVHHKIHLSEDNYRNPSIALNFQNLESLCKDCHNKEHFGEKVEARWSFNSDGEFEMR